jgi:dihydroflavonol-4-reductase
VLNRALPGYIDGGFCAIDVDDVAEGHVLAEEKGRVGERYILGNHNLTWKEFFALVGEVSGVRPPRLRMPSWAAMGLGRVSEAVADRLIHKPPATTYKQMKYASLGLYFDPSKARRELGLPCTPLRQTIEKSVRWFRAHGYAPSA